jgi:hypothetical protein
MDKRADRPSYRSWFSSRLGSFTQIECMQALAKWMSATRLVIDENLDHWRKR